MNTIASRSWPGLLLIAWWLTQAPLHGGTGGTGVDRSRAEQLVIEHTNKFRSKNGLGKLQENAGLAKAARHFAEYMAHADQCSHTADGSHPWKRAARHHYTYCFVTENIGFLYSSAGFTTRGLAARFVRGWRNSPGHRRNMLDSALCDIGVGVARSDRSGKYYAVQMFGRPRSKRITFRVSNQSDSVVRYAIGGHALQIVPRATRRHGQCRPGALVFYWPRSAAPTTQDATPTSQEVASAEEGGDESYGPSDGAHYIIHQDEAGNHFIELKQTHRADEETASMEPGTSRS